MYSKMKEGEVVIARYKASHDTFITVNDRVTKEIEATVNISRLAMNVSGVKKFKDEDAPTINKIKSEIEREVESQIKKLEKNIENILRDYGFKV